jgi:hypothetical protein
VCCRHADSSACPAPNSTTQTLPLDEEVEDVEALVKVVVEVLLAVEAAVDGRSPSLKMCPAMLACCAISALLFCRFLLEEAASISGWQDFGR